MPKEHCRYRFSQCHLGQEATIKANDLLYKKKVNFMLRVAGKMH